jgi:hypothetical protein
MKARLARVGDPIEFVVTLGLGDSSAEGLLERQTPTGTVAVRRLDGADCEQVADAIALTLTLSDVPAPERPVAPVATAEQLAPHRADLPRESPSTDAGAQTPQPARHPRWAVGAQGGAMFGVTPAALPGGALFLEVEPHVGDGSLLQTAALRAYALAGASTDSGEPRIWIVGGRFEGCPLRWGGTFTVSPCASFELGTLHATGGGPDAKSDQGLWAALGASGQFAARVTETLSVEVDATAVIPLKRYDFVSQQSTNPVYAAAPIGLNAVAGFSARLP